jgi:hypothetical protein
MRNFLVYFEGPFLFMNIPPRELKGILHLLLESGSKIMPSCNRKIPPTFKEV